MRAGPGMVPAMTQWCIVSAQTVTPCRPSDPSLRLAWQSPAPAERSVPPGRQLGASPTARLRGAPPAERTDSSSSAEPCQQASCCVSSGVRARGAWPVRGKGHLSQDRERARPRSEAVVCSHYRQSKFTIEVTDSEAGSLPFKAAFVWLSIKLVCVCVLK